MTDHRLPTRLAEQFKDFSERTLKGVDKKIYQTGYVWL